MERRMFLELTRSHVYLSSLIPAVAPKYVGDSCRLSAGITFIAASRHSLRESPACGGSLAKLEIPDAERQEAESGVTLCLDDPEQREQHARLLTSNLVSSHLSFLLWYSVPLLPQSKPQQRSNYMLLWFPHILLCWFCYYLLQIVISLQASTDCFFPPR